MLCQVIDICDKYLILSPSMGQTSARGVLATATEKERAVVVQNRLVPNVDGTADLWQRADGQQRRAHRGRGGRGLGRDLPVIAD